MEGFNYIQNVTDIELDQGRCIGCRACLTVCPHNVFEMQGKSAVIVKRNDCMECGACAQNCTANAITVNPGVGCAALIISRWLAKVGIQSRGCC